LGLGGMSHAVARVVRLVPGVVMVGGGKCGGGRWWRVV
jgi:hypothetical protein